MASNSFNVEVIPQLQRAVETFDEAKVKMHKGVESAVEVAEESGSGNLTKSAQNMKEGTDALEKTMVETSDSLSKVIQYYRDLDEALNA